MLPVDLGQQLDISIRLLMASVLGAAIGFEREIHLHPAGMRTHLLVALGSAAFSVLSIFFFVSPTAPDGSTDPSRIAAQIVSGIGFLGAGAILKLPEERRIEGLTTAAGIWLTATIGIAAGLGRESTAVIGTLLAAVVLVSLGWWGKRKRPDNDVPAERRVEE